MRSSAVWALTIIFLANFFNYVDRQLVSALEKQLHDEPTLRLGETQFGMLWTLFTVGYMLCAVPIGLLADRTHRPRLFAICIVIWSVATVISGMAESRTVLYVARIFIGVGEAGCLVIGPALLSDLFSLKDRSRALSIFYLGMPLGGVMAYLMVAILHDDMPWRYMFYLAGFPGFLLAALVALMPDPPRGKAEELAGHHVHKPGKGRFRDYLQLLRTRTLLLVILAQACAVVILVPLLHFGKRFFLERRNLTEEKAGLALGAMALIGGLGSLISGVLGERLARRVKGGYALLAGLGYLLALPCLYVGFTWRGPAVFLPALCLGAFFLFMCMPAVNTQIANVVNPRQRATAWALAVFILHLLGDTLSPPVFGLASKEIGRERAFLFFALALVPAALCCFLAVLTAPRDLQRVTGEVPPPPHPPTGGPLSGTL